MTRLARLLIVIFATATGAAPAVAQEWILGIGAADFSSALGQDGGLLALEYRPAAFYSNRRIDIGWAVAAEVHSTGDIFVGAGLAATWTLDRRWFLDASVIPGLYAENDWRNDLGSSFEIRSLLALGYRLDDRNAISLAASHKSNASTAAFNPGVNAVLLRWHRRF